MLTPEALLTLAAELTDAAAEGDAESLAAIAWRLYGEAGENLAEIGRLRAAIHAAWTRPQETPPPAPAAAWSETAGTGAASGSTAMPHAKAKPGRRRREQAQPPSRRCQAVLARGLLRVSRLVRSAAAAASRCSRATVAASAASLERDSLISGCC